MASDNPFNNLNDLPERVATALAAVVTFLLLAVSLLILAPRPVNWILATAISIHTVRMAWRFWHRRRR